MSSFFPATWFWMEKEYLVLLDAQNLFNWHTLEELYRQRDSQKSLLAVTIQHSCSCWKLKEVIQVGWPNYSDSCMLLVKRLFYHHHHLFYWQHADFCLPTIHLSVYLLCLCLYYLRFKSFVYLASVLLTFLLPHASSSPCVIGLQHLHICSAISWHAVSKRAVYWLSQLFQTSHTIYSY